MTNPISSAIITRRNARLGFLCFCAIVAGIGAATNAWLRELNPDEAKYYAPAIEFVSHSLPTFPLRDYPFPAPPLALWAQATVAKAFHNLASVRVFSTLCAACLAGYLLLGRDPRGRVPALGIVALLTFPFFLWNAFTIKQHAFTASCLLIGLERWCTAEDAHSDQELWASSAFLTVATLSNQFCAPLCASLCLDSLLRTQRPFRVEKARILFSAVPLICLGLLMLYWGGKQPPTYIDPLPSAISIGWQSRLAQFALGAISVGVWVGTLSFDYRLHARPFLLALIPALLVVWLSRLYSPSGDFWTTGQGPISRALFALFRGNPSLLILVSGMLAALGVAFWVAPGMDTRWTGRCRILIVAYLAIAAIAVPYLFESYYLLLIMPLLFVVLRKSPILALNRVRTSIGEGGIVCAGIAYAVFKLKVG